MRCSRRDGLSRLVLRSAADCDGLLRVRRGQEGNDCVGDGAGGSPGQVMARAFDELEASVRQGLRQVACGIDWDQCVLRVCEHEHRRFD